MLSRVSVSVEATESCTRQIGLIEPKWRCRPTKDSISFVHMNDLHHLIGYYPLVSEGLAFKGVRTKSHSNNATSKARSLEAKPSFEIFILPQDEQLLNEDESTSQSHI